GLRAYAGRTDPTGTAFTATLDLAPDLPLPPVHLEAIRDPATGDIVLSWLRCSRADTDSWVVADAPLDFSPEAYAVTVFDGGSAVRTLATGVPAATYAAAELHLHRRAGQRRARRRPRGHRSVPWLSYPRARSSPPASPKCSARRAAS